MILPAHTEYKDYANRNDFLFTTFQLYIHYIHAKFFAQFGKTGILINISGVVTGHITQ